MLYILYCSTRFSNDFTSRQIEKLSSNFPFISVMQCSNGQMTNPRHLELFLNRQSQVNNRLVINDLSSNLLHTLQTTIDSPFLQYYTHFFEKHGHLNVPCRNLEKNSKAQAFIEEIWQAQNPVLIDKEQEGNTTQADLYQKKDILRAKKRKTQSCMFIPTYFPDSPVSSEDEFDHTQLKRLNFSSS
jgi:hypothetical protein